MAREMSTAARGSASGHGRRRAWRKLVPIGLLVSAALGVSARPAGAASPSVGGPHKVAGDYYATYSRAAFDGTNYLLVWSTNSHVFAARASGDGSVAQPLGEISETDEESNVDVAFDGTNYLVVWEHAYSNDDHDIRGQVISKSGALIGSNLQLDAALSDSHTPAITAAGSTFFITWQDDRGGNPDIYGRRFGATGSAIDQAPVAIATNAKTESSPAVAWNGTNYLVTYQLAFTTTDPDVYGRAVSGAASPLGTAQPIHATDSPEQRPTVASNGRTSSSSGRTAGRRRAPTTCTARGSARAAPS